METENGKTTEGNWKQKLDSATGRLAAANRTNVALQEENKRLQTRVAELEAMTARANSVVPQQMNTVFGSVDNSVIEAEAKAWAGDDASEEDVNFMTGVITTVNKIMDMRMQSAATSASAPATAATSASAPATAPENSDTNVNPMVTVQRALALQNGLGAFIDRLNNDDEYRKQYENDEVVSSTLAVLQNSNDPNQIKQYSNILLEHVNGGKKENRNTSFEPQQSASVGGSSLYQRMSLIPSGSTIQNALSNFESSRNMGDKIAAGQQLLNLVTRGKRP